MHKKYVGLPLLVCYVLLGQGDGGLEQRPHTRVIIMEPARAWRLPDDVATSRDADLDSTYRWPVIGRRLAAALQEFTAEKPEMLRHACNPGTAPQRKLNR